MVQIILLFCILGSFRANLICSAVDPLAPTNVIAKIDATLDGDIKMFSCLSASPATA